VLRANAAGDREPLDADYLRKLERKIFMLQCNDWGFVYFWFDPDGNCFFTATAAQLRDSGCQITAVQLRHAICDHIAQNYFLYCDFVPGGDVGSYVTHMRLDKVWGDNLCMRACMILFQAAFQIYGPDGIVDFHLPVDFDVRQIKRVIVLAYYKDHFDGLRRADGRSHLRAFLASCDSEDVEKAVIASLLEQVEEAPVTTLLSTTNVPNAPAENDMAGKWHLVERTPCMCTHCCRCQCERAEHGY